jgi:hypothetical protein
VALCDGVPLVEGVTDAVPVALCDGVPLVEGVTEGEAVGKRHIDEIL